MKFKKVAAIMLAMALAVSGSVFSAAPVFAGTITTSVEGTSVNSDGSYVIDFFALGIDASNATKAAVTVKITDMSGGAGGGIAVNSSAKDWTMTEWGNEGADKPITLKNTDTADVYDIVMTFDKGDLAAPDGANGQYAQIFLQSWWGADVEVLKVTAYNSDGSVLCEVPSKSGGSSASSPVLSEKSLTLAVGKSATLSVTGNSGSIKWKSSKKTVAKVNKKGQVKAIAAGKAVIKAKVDGKTLKCKVKVTA